MNLVSVHRIEQIQNSHNISFINICINIRLLSCNIVISKTMQAAYFTSFGLLMSLMLKAKNNLLKISSQVNLTIHPHVNIVQKMEEEKSEVNYQQYTPQRKKKKKIKKGGQKNEAKYEQIKLYPRNSLTEVQLKKKWDLQQKQKSIKCINVGKQLEAIQGYFYEEMESILPYNGKKGKYRLTIPIPGTNYSQIPINIILDEQYPFELPEIQIQTHNLHPLEKQKLNQISKQQKLQFMKHQFEFADVEKKDDRGIIEVQEHIKSEQDLFKSNSLNDYNNSLATNNTKIEEEPSLKKSRSSQQEPHFYDPNSRINPLRIKQCNREKYLSQYYPYLFNLFSSIYLQLFYRVSEEESKLQPIVNNLVNEKQKRQQEEELIKMQNKKQEAKKQILANMLEEIFYQYEEDNNKNNKSVISMNKMEELPANKKQPAQQQNHNSRGRYIADYEELEKAGEGGFGRVYKCKNKVDSNIYAVKKMVINYNDPQSRKFLKEVALLSKLNHPNIVRYHQSWLQDTMSVNQLIADMSITEPSQIQQFNNIWKDYMKEHRRQEEQSLQENLSDQQSVMFGDDIVFMDNGYSDILFVDDSSSDKSQSKRKISSKNISESESSRKQSSYSFNSSAPHHLHHKNSADTHQFPFKILYIVMEYCGGMTLRDYIGKRFNEPNELKIKLIRGILQGLSYIHSRRIIHRDLKPANIFLIEGTNKVKIGDFGLATVGNIENNPYEAEIIQYSEKTKGVGTTFYRAPEQLKSSHYDEKIDIYSLGIIMLEMFYQFGTNMERHQVLNDVTKNFKLPKDFNKNQQYLQHGQQIQSCISPRSQDRPTVQKLLEAFRNKYFTQLVSVIANPKHFQFYQLINHLFRIKNQSGSVMKQILYRNYLTNQFIRIYQNHRGILFTPLSLVPIVDYETINGVKIPVNRKDKYLLLSERGVVMEYASTTFNTWIRYAKETLKRTRKGDIERDIKEQRYFQANQELRRFTFEKVADFIGGDVKNEFSFKQKYVTAFDITYPLDEGDQPFFLCEILKISLSMVETMDLTQKKPPIYICHSLIFEVLANSLKINEVNLYKFLLSINDEKFRSLKNFAKIDWIQKFKIQTNIAKKLINLMQIQFQNSSQFLEKIGELEGKNFSTQMMAIQESILQIMKELEIFGLDQSVKWKVMIPPSYCEGFFWNVGPIKGFTAIEQYLPGCDLCNLHIQTPINLGNDSNEADVSIWSNGQFLKKDIFEIVSKCWQNNVTVKWYNQSIGEKDLSCRNNIILKKKIERVHLMIRKNHQSGFNHGHLHGLGMTVDKKHSEQDRQGSFIPKDSFNFEVLGSLSKKNLLSQHH